MNDTLAKLQECIHKIDNSQWGTVQRRIEMAKDAIQYCKALEALLVVHTR